VSVDLDRLEALAKAATSGDRKAKRVYSRDQARQEYGADKACWWVEGAGWIDLEDYGLFFTEADAKLFEATDPQTVLELVEQVRNWHAYLRWRGSQDDKQAGP
jgi:hypothetical protein